MPKMIRVKEFSKPSELEGLRPMWNGLLQNSRDNDVFSTWEWLCCWWKHFGMDRQLRVLVGEEDDQIVGIAPLMLSSYRFVTRFMNIGKVNKIEFIGSPQSDYNNFILLSNEEECLKAFLGYLMEQSDWDWLHLLDIPEASLSAKLLWGLPRDPWGLAMEFDELCPYVKLPDSIDVLARKLPGRTRKDIRRESRELSEKYLVAFKTHADFRSTDEAMNVLFDLHERRMSTLKISNSGFTRSRDFHAHIAREFASKGWLYLSFLTANGQPVASGYSFHYGQKSYQYQGGFDPTFGRYGVRTLLHMNEVEVCIQKGFKEYDFTRGGEPYKLRWPTEIRRNFQLNLVRRGWLPKIYRGIRRNNTLEPLTKLINIELC